MKKIFYIIMLLILLISCKQIGDDNNKVDVNGTYTGIVEGTQEGVPFSTSTTMTLSQSGDDVTGTWTTGGGSSGTLSGTISGDKIGTFVLNQTNPCPGTFTGTATIHNKGERITGGYNGNDCAGTTTASFDVSK